MRPFLKILIIFCFANKVYSQNILTPEAAVQAALQHHPLAKAAAYASKAKKQSEKAALNLPNPEVNAESPTGEFYAVGVLQSFEFPTVYARQKKLARAETAQTMASQQMTENDLRLTVRSLYSIAQEADYQSLQWALRDSLYQSIALAARRQFVAGEIDFLQKTSVENEAGKVHQERLAADKNAALHRQQLATFAGLGDVGILLPLRADSLISPDLSGNPVITFQEKSIQVANRQESLARSRSLPNFSLGYLNQGIRNTPIDYRFRASIGVPLWFGQYRALNQAAKTEKELAIARSEAAIQSIRLELEQAQAEAKIAWDNVQYYELEAIPRNRLLVAAATRMREAGQVDYIAYLRILDESFSIQLDYAAQLRALRTAQNQILYLSGQ